MKITELNYKVTLKPIQLFKSDIQQEIKIRTEKSLEYLEGFNWRRKCKCGGYFVSKEGRAHNIYMNGSSCEIKDPDIVSCDKCHAVYDLSESSDNVTVFWNDSDYRCAQCGKPLFAFSRKGKGEEGRFYWNR
jgi:hypothetical protein